MTPQQKRFERLLPFYVNGTLERDDLAFMQDYLVRHEGAARALALTRHIQQTVQSMAHEQPQASAVERFITKWAQASQQSRPLAKPATDPVARGPSMGAKFNAWWIGLVGLGVAAMVATVLLLPGVTTVGALHVDGLDGRPDLEVVLAQNISPDHQAVIAHLKRFNGQIVAQSEQDGYHRISIDLQNRAADQHELIAVLQSDGHLQSYTLLASR